MAHTLEVIFKESPFDEVYFTLQGHKTVRLPRYNDNTCRLTMKNLDLTDRNGDESVRFAISARGVVGDQCQLTINVDGKEIAKYEDLTFAANGWVSVVDIVYIK